MGVGWGVREDNEKSIPSPKCFVKKHLPPLPTKKMVLLKNVYTNKQYVPSQIALLKPPPPSLSTCIVHIPLKHLYFKTILSLFCIFTLQKCLHINRQPPLMNFVK